MSSESTETEMKDDSNDKQSPQFDQRYANKTIIDKIVYTKAEYSMIEQFIQFATDQKEHPWVSQETDIDDFKMEYVGSENTESGICIARGTAIINCNSEDLFFGYDQFDKVKDLDENCLSVELKHKFDIHRRIISGSFSAPAFSPVWNREFLFKEVRAILDEDGKIIHQSANENIKKIDLKNVFMNMKKRSVVCFGYSVPAEMCPFDDAVREDHVRGDLKFGGYLFTNIGNNKCRATYLVCMDLKGWIPQWVTNLILPQQSKNILTMKEYAEKELNKLKCNSVNE